MILGDWVEEDLIAQNFWRHTFFPVSYTNNSGTEVPSTDLQTLLGITPLSWADVALNYYSDIDAVVYGAASVVLPGATGLLTIWDMPILYILLLTMVARLLMIILNSLSLNRQPCFFYCRG